MVNIKKSKGFTLIELVVTMVVVAVLAGAIGPYLVETVKAVNAAYIAKAIGSQGRVALELISQDIRNTREASAGGDLTVGANTVTVNTLAGETVSYSLSGTNLIKTVDGVASTLATNVSSLSFSYYSSSGTTTSTASQVRYVKPSFTLSKDGETQTFSMLVTIRNA